MVTRSQARKPAGKPVLLRKETASPIVGVDRTCGSSSIARVKRLLLCLAASWTLGDPFSAGACHSGTSQQQGLFWAFIAGQGPAGDACVEPISLCCSCIQAHVLRWGEWLVDRAAMPLAGCHLLCSSATNHRVQTA